MWSLLFYMSQCLSDKKLNTLASVPERNFDKPCLESAFWKSETLQNIDLQFRKMELRLFYVFKTTEQFHW